MKSVWTQDEEAERLSRRFDNVNQRKFAVDFAVPGGASMITQHKNGLRPINIEAAMAYAKGFGVSLWEISPRLAQLVVDAYSTLGDVEGGLEREGDLPEALATLGAALAIEMPDDVRQDAADLLAKLAHRRGAARHQTELFTLLTEAGLTTEPALRFGNG